jgi:hypothetical protein
MVRIWRGTTPAWFRSPRVQRLRRDAERFFKPLPSERRQHRFEFDVPDQTRLLKALYETFADKCACCESPLAEATDSHIDWYRPRFNALGADGRVAPDHYWWLAYEWRNLYLVCARCGRSKRNRFPVERPRAERRTPFSRLAEERPMLLDPCGNDVPAEHLRFTTDRHAQAQALTERGRVTIEILELNRPDLTRARADALHRLEEEWRPAGSNLRHLAGLLSSRHPYAAIRRERVAEYVAASPRLLVSVRRNSALWNMLRPYVDRPSVARSIPHQAPAPTALQMLHRIEISNFRAIRSLSLTFELSTGSDETPWLVVLGENGTGKTSLLHAVALALMTPWQRSAYGITVSDVLRAGADVGHVKLTFSSGAEPLICTFNRRTRKFSDHRPMPGTLPIGVLLGFGPTRLLPRGHHKPPPKKPLVNVHTLFDPFVPLVDAERWLRTIDTTTFDYAARSLKAVLDLDRRSQFVRPRRGGPVKVRLYGALRRFSELGTGHQSMLALVVDVMSAVARDRKIVEEAEGLVLVDELDVHLHPRWSMRVVRGLRQAFPRLQFLCTTHDPLCLRGLRANEVAVMQRTERNRIVALTTGLPPVDALRVDQLLTSEYFGLHSAMDPDLENLFAAYYELRSRRHLSVRERERLRQLEDQLEGRELLGSTKRERLMYQAVDDLVAREDKTRSQPKRGRLRAATRARLAKIWAQA